MLVKLLDQNKVFSLMGIIIHFTAGSLLDHRLNVYGLFGKLSSSVA